MQFANQLKLGTNVLANEEGSGHNLPAWSHRRGTILSLSRSKQTRPDGGGASERGVSLGSDGCVGLCGRGTGCCVSLARFAEGAKDSPQCPASYRTIFIGLFYNQFLPRSEEHTSELQSQSNLVCRLLLEKKKKD